MYVCVGSFVYMHVSSRSEYRVCVMGIGQGRQMREAHCRSFDVNICMHVLCLNLCRREQNFVACMYTHTHIYIYIYIYIRMCIEFSVYSYSYRVQTHIHIHTCMNIVVNSRKSTL